MTKNNASSVFYKTIIYYLIFIPVIFLLYACPFSSVYKLDKEASVPVDEVLLGKWATTFYNKTNQAQKVQMILDKKNENEYGLLLVGNFNDLKPYKIVKNDSITAVAFMSFINDRPMLNVEIKGQTYITAVVYKNDTLSLLPLADGFTAKYLRSDADVRTAVEAHLRRRVFPKYEEQFCLRKMVRVN